VEKVKASANTNGATTSTAIVVWSTRRRLAVTNAPGEEREQGSPTARHPRDRHDGLGQVQSADTTVRFRARRLGIERAREKPPEQPVAGDPGNPCPRRGSEHADSAGVLTPPEERDGDHGEERHAGGHDRWSIPREHDATRTTQRRRRC
jgi:hypothetical protein